MYSLLFSIPFAILILFLTYRITTSLRPHRAAFAAGAICVAGALVLLVPMIAVTLGVSLGQTALSLGLTTSASWAFMPAALAFGILGLLAWAHAGALPRGAKPLLWVTALAYVAFRALSLLQYERFMRAINDTPREAKWTQFETTMPVVARIMDVTFLLTLITMVYLIGTAVLGWRRRRRNAS